MTTSTRFALPNNECVLPDTRIAILYPPGYRDRKLFMALLQRLRERFTIFDVYYLVEDLSADANPYREYIEALQLVDSPFVLENDSHTTYQRMLVYATHVILIDPTHPLMQTLKAEWEPTQRPLREIPVRTK